MHKTRASIKRMIKRMIMMAIIGATFAEAGSQPGETPAAGNSGAGKIDDLGVEQLSPESIRLTWTAPAKTGAGAVSSYEIRTADNLITETTWPKARPVAGTPVPAAPGTPQSLILYKLTPNKRCWFAIKAFDGAKASRISNSAANPPAGLDQVDVFTMACWCLDARTRRLVLALQPDFVERQHMEFFLSVYMDRNYEGVPFRNLLKQRGALLGNGMNYKELFDVNNVGAALGGSPCEKRNMDRLMEKSRKLIDLGWEAIEYDLTAMNEDCWKPLSEQLHAYAQSKGQRLLLTGNGSDVPGERGPGGKQFIHADYGLYQYPRNWSAPVNYIDDYRAMVVRDGQKPAFAFVDCGLSEFDPSPCLPKDKTLYPAFYRFNEAQLMAAGIIPGSTRLYLNNTDAYEIGVFFVEMNNAKFLRENRELLHNLSYLKPATLACAKPNIYLSVLGQDGRTLLHLVNGNINIRANAQVKQADFTVRIALDKAPTRVWMTTPDKLWDTRRQNLAHTYENGIAAITIPEIEYHDLVVIEQGNAYDPVYSPMEIVFPFPLRKTLPAGNKIRFHAIATEGHSRTFDWEVNETPGGGAGMGVVDAEGRYTAPSNAPSPASVAIKARSREAGAIHNGFEIRITPPLALPWAEKFASDNTGAIPSGWEIVDGKGDWRIAMDGTEKVLHQFNVFDVIAQQNESKSVNDLYGYSALIASGDQNWTRHAFSFKVKYVIAPYQTGRISAVFGYKDGGNYHEYWLVGKEARLFTARLFTHVGGKMTEAGEPVACPSPSLNAYTDIKVAVNGADSCLFVNGALVRRDGNPPASGGIGFGASSTECYFKNIEVANPGVE